MSNYYNKGFLVTVLAILSLSTIIPGLSFAAPLGDNGRDWMNTNGNTWAWNYSPQNQINTDNVEQLEVKWLYPIGGKSLAPAAIQAAGIGEGATTPPIVRDGVVYIITSYMNTIAIDAESGKALWSHQYSIDIDEAQERLPIFIAGSVHKHGFQYWESENQIINHGLACDFYGVDADSGEMTFHVQDLCLDIEGTLGKYLNRRAGAEPSIGIYDKGNQFIYVLSGYIHSTISGPDARHVTLGIDQDTHEVIWRVFSSPPQDKPAKDWALDECDTGFFREIPCSEVAAVNREGLEWDWALEGEPASIYGGVTANWGQAVIDEDTGLMYTQTGNQGPYSNLSFTPGPRLYGSTIMAIDLNSGQRVWWLQPFPHDPYDYDCNWSGMLIDNPTLGKVYVKGCKEGVFYVMDAATGEPKYKVDVRDDMFARGQISANPHDMIYEPDPKSYHDMREWNWISWPATAPGEPGEHFTLPAEIFPHFMNGVFNTDMSFDPDNQNIILYEGALQVTITQEFPIVLGNSLFRTRASPNTNTTIVARSIETGEVEWTWYYDVSQQRAAMIVSGDMVFTGFPDGMMRFLNKDNGNLIHEMNLGAAIVTQPTVGADSAGNSKIFVIAGVTGISAYIGGVTGPAVPGTLIALGLSDAAQVEVTTTVTTTATTTSATTSTVTSATTSTVTSSTTSTVTSEVIEETGLPAEITYAAVAVAVIAIVAAAFLMMRKR
jgi:outer membrane protein assembly factor BamB